MVVSKAKRTVHTTFEAVEAIFFFALIREYLILSKRIITFVMHWLATLFCSCSYARHEK